MLTHSITRPRHSIFSPSARVRSTRTGARGIAYEDRARAYSELAEPLSVKRTPRPFQSEALEAFRKARGRGVIVDRVAGLDAVGRLWDLGVDYLQGDALAAAGPRLDFDFAG